MQYSDTTNRTGIIQMLEDYTNTQSSTSSSYPLATKTRDINNAFAYYMVIADKAPVNWKPVDDTNQTDYPIIFGDVVSGQQDYSFNTDENGNQILDIYKVRIKDSNGTWRTLTQINRDDLDDDYLNSTITGIPSRYYLTTNGIFLVEIPNFTQEDSLEVFISRTPTYFLSTDTTKKPGIPDMFHEYLVVRPAYFFSLAKGLPRAKEYGQTMLDMEKNIKDYYSKRNRDFIPIITSEYVCSE